VIHARQAGERVRASRRCWCAGINEGAYSIEHRLFQEIEGAEILVSTNSWWYGHYMGLVQGGRMKDGIDALHTLPDELAVGDGPDLIGKGRWNDVDTDDLMVRIWRVRTKASPKCHCCL